MRNSGVFGALLFAVLLSTGCRGVFPSGEPESFDWQQDLSHTRKKVAAKPSAKVQNRKSLGPDASVRPVSFVAASVTIPEDYLNDPPPSPPTELAASGLIRRSQERMQPRPRAFPTASEAEPIEPVEVQPSRSRVVKKSTANGGAQLRWKESGQSQNAPRMLEPSFDVAPAAEHWDALPDEDSDANPLRSVDERPVVSAARWTYDRSDAQSNLQLRANPLRP